MRKKTKTHRPRDNCTLQGCKNPRKYKLYCHKHQNRLRKYGKPEYCKFLNREDEFWLSVEKSNRCWLWTRWLDKDGYGEFSVCGKKWKAHRYSYYLSTGCIPKLHILHSCDTPNCVNPSHLSEGTNKENVNDKVRKKRHCFGSKHSKAKLKEHDIPKILQLINKGVKQADIAKKYNVSKSLICSLNKRKRWTHVIDK